MQPSRALIALSRALIVPYMLHHTSVAALRLPPALSYQCMRPWASSECGRKLQVHDVLRY
jgi:hypothetical protein